MANVTMPQLGETVVEGTILKWLKSEGEHVDQDEPLFEISTDKVDTEVPSPAAGTLTKILVPEGSTVAVGTDLAEIDGAGTGGGGSQAAGSELAPRPEPSVSAGGASSPVASEGVRPPPEAPPGDAVGTPVQASAPVESPQVEPAAGDAGGAATAPPPGMPATAPGPRADPSAPATRPPSAGSANGAPAQAGGGPRSGILSPLVRRLAAEHGVDLSEVTGTGTGGRITKNDVLDHVAARGAPSATAGPERPAAVGRPAAAGEEVVQLSTLRKAIAQHMTASAQTAARAWTAVEVNLESVVRLRERAKQAFADREGFKLTYLPFVARAVTEALVSYPMVNAELRGEEIILRRYVNLGIAVSIEGGLIVPVVRNADAMNVIGLARAIADVAARARNKQLAPDEVHGHTFSITNPGPFGSLVSVPIINQPNTGILSLDAVQKRPVVIDDAIAIRHMVYLSMSWDHRTIDGALATQFLARVKHNLEAWDFAEDLGL
jgi:pyruvate dehydrogenase E2 component (dihydrolipoamide acetyltransferase)